MLNTLANVTRLDVIGPNSRIFSEWDVTIQVSVQDEGRTLKLFLTRKRVCTCNHSIRLHDVAINRCKLSSCKKCKGFKESVRKLRGR